MIEAKHYDNVLTSPLKINFRFISSNIPASPTYVIYISQSILNLEFIASMSIYGQYSPADTEATQPKLRYF